MDNDNSYISVIIPTYHDDERLGNCLEALAIQSIGQNNFEVIVVNNDPSSPLPFSGKGNVIVAEEKKRGSYSARNTGIRMAKGDILAFTDSDCLPDPEWLARASEKFQTSPHISRLAGGIQLFFDSEKLSMSDCYELVFGFKQEQFVREGKAVTANMFARKEVFQSIGDFNESIQSGGDMEWGMRAQNAGYQIEYDERILIKHPSRSELKALIKKSKRVAEGILNKRNSQSVVVSLLYLLAKLVPPFHELSFIWSRGKDLSFNQKLVVFVLRFRIRIVREIEIIRLLT